MQWLLLVSIKLPQANSALISESFLMSIYHLYLYFTSLQIDGSDCGDLYTLYIRRSLNILSYFYLGNKYCGCCLCCGSFYKLKCIDLPTYAAKSL